MARPKKIVPAYDVVETYRNKPTKLAEDFSSEGLNNMARKINEIIDHLNG